MNDTPAASRLSIGIFGKRNAGKSSLINALTGQNISIVSEIPGTTTDPVAKTMEIRGLGPVIIHDTAGIDDTGPLGAMRISRTKDVMRRVDVAIVVSTYSTFGEDEIVLLDEIISAGRRVMVVFNKSDVEAKLEDIDNLLIKKGVKYVFASCKTGLNIDACRKLLIDISSDLSTDNPTILGDLIKQGDFVVLVVPIDLGAPKGRLILPQVQAIRDILDNDCIAVTAKERELKYLLD
ncbi:MAG TPA: GTP-binding protein, partial [Candidatus Goldiibacteriota bacterium]|nr:GTP-binding protein [Candidatus Goldiibacteriota bacterium]